MTVPFVTKLQMDITSLAATVDFSACFQPVPFAAQVTLVQYVPDQTQLDITADTLSAIRFFSLKNLGQAGTTSAAGTTKLANALMVSTSASITAFGTSTSAGLHQGNASSIPLTATTAFLTLAAGDILQWESSHSGATGVRDPGGRVIVTLSRV